MPATIVTSGKKRKTRKSATTVTTAAEESPKTPPANGNGQGETIDLEEFYHSYISCLNNRTFSKLDEFVSPNVTHNDNPIGLKGYIEMLEKDVLNIPDLYFCLATLVCQGNWIAARLSYNCSPKGTFLDIPVNGARVEFCENVFYRLEKGRIVQVQSVIDKVALEKSWRDQLENPIPTFTEQGENNSTVVYPSKIIAAKSPVKIPNYGQTYDPDWDPDTYEWKPDIDPATFKQVTKPTFVSQFKVDGLSPNVGAEVYYQPDFIPIKDTGVFYAALMELDSYQPELKMYGRTFPQSRHIAAYSTDPNSTLKYSGSEIKMNHPFPPILLELQKRIESPLGVRFNHVMLNRYDDGSVYIGRHSDNENNLVIASISLGAERTMIMTPREPTKRKFKSETKSNIRSPAKGPVPEIDLSERSKVQWKLANGSLLVMQGQTQKYWKHEIPRELPVKQGRISITFRQLI